MDEKAQGVSRLGKRELGSHAFEERMPDAIRKKLEKDGTRNKLSNVPLGLINVLRDQPGVMMAWLCDLNTVQVYKFHTEGNHFCAYRNIQMILPGEFRTVPEIQDLIEKAWDMGHNAHGRIETGGIKDTRKHVGTSEVQALMKSLQIPCKVHAFEGENAYQELLDSVETYFEDSQTSVPGHHVYGTTCPPIFLQRPNHSLTIVGIERSPSGQRRLLVFDPAYQPPRAFRRSCQSKFHLLPRSVFVRRVLDSYRRDEGYLKGFKSFETLRLV